MDILLLIFTGSLICALVIGVISFVRYGRSSTITQVCFVIILSLMTSYCFSLIQLCFDPYFIDNGSKEFIDWPFRWAWATVGAGLFQFITVPIGLAGYVYFHKVKPSA